MVKELNHVGILTCNVEESLHFYLNVLGGKIIKDAYSKDGKSRYVYVQIAQSVIELITCFDENTQGYAHIALLLNGKTLDILFERLIDRCGCKPCLRPKTAGSGDGRLAFFEDLGGILMEIIERTEDIRKPSYGDERIERILYTQVTTSKEIGTCGCLWLNELNFHQTESDTYELGCDTLKLVSGSTGIQYIAMKVRSAEALDAILEQVVSQQQEDGGYVIHAPSGEKLVLYK